MKSQYQVVYIIETCLSILICRLHMHYVHKRYKLERKRLISNHFENSGKICAAFIILNLAL